jgi:hypothetical protein
MRKGAEGARTDFRALGTLAREAATGEVDEAKHLAGRARLVEAIDAERSRGRSGAGARWAMALAAVVVIVAGGWGITRFRAPEWTVDGAVAQGEGFVNATADHAATIRFNDGSSVALSPKTRARVVRGDHRHVVLEDGRAEVKVSKGGPMLAFAFDAGPFTVKTSPGAVSLEWSGDREQLDVWPGDAETTVQGGVAGGGVALHGGDHLVARVREGELRVVRADGRVTLGPDVTTSDGVDAAPPDATGNAIVTTSPDDSPEVANPNAMPAPAPGAPHVAWSKLVARGDYDTVLREANALGIDAVLDGRPLADLTALADASRYRRKADVAQRTLLAERSRFPGTKQAHEAAFLLGRLADDQSSTAAAIPWYDRYLAEAPNGPFASDALGRKMIAVDRLQGPDAARALADQYAKRYPRGAYAAQAEELRTH